MKRVRSMGALLKGLLAAALVIVVLVVFAGFAAFTFPSLNPFRTESTTSNEAVVKSVRLDQQVVLVSLGIQGIKSKESKSRVFGVPVPGSKRAMYLQYSYYAKLGIDGKEVKIDKIGDKKYRITVPEFIFLGHQDEKFQLAVEKNGAISFVTPEIDEAELITEVLNQDAKDQHVKDNKEVLKAQAQAFYTGILHGVDPELSAEFVFADN